MNALVTHYCKSFLDFLAQFVGKTGLLRRLNSPSANRWLISRCLSSGVFGKTDKGFFFFIG